MNENDKVRNLKNNPPNEKLEIIVKTFFGYEITVIEEDGNYKVKSEGIRGLIDKIIWFFFAPTLKSRQAAVEKSLKDNNALVPDKGNKSEDQNEQSLRQIYDPQNHQFRIQNSNKEKTFDDLVNSEIEQAKKELNLSEKEYSEIIATISMFKGNEFTEDGMFSFVKDTIIQLREKSPYSPDNKNNKSERYSNSNEKDSIGNQTNINNDNRNNSFIKDRESERRANNEISENSNSRRDKNINDIESITNKRKKKFLNIADRTRSKFDLKNKNINDIKGITNERKKKSLNIAGRTRSKLDLLPNNEFIKKDNNIISENLQSKNRIDNPSKEKTFDDLVNSEIGQAKGNFDLSDEECNEIRKRIYNSVNFGFKDPSVIKDTIDQFIKEKYGNEDGNNNINNKLNINNHDKIDKDLVEIENADNEFSIFNNEDNNINFVNGQNSARTDVNNMCHNSSILSKEELNEIEGQINDLRKVGDYTEETLALLKQNLIEEAIEKKKSGKENLEYQRQLEKVIEQSKSENENVEKKYKEAESNLEKMIPNGYRVTSFDKGDGIIGDGNCFYRAIAKLENGNQEGYSEIRKTISDEINKSAELVGKSDYKIDDNLLYILQIYAEEYNELKDVEVAKNNLSNVLYQIREHVEGKDKKNEYAGPIEAYFYAKATKKVVIIYDSNDQISVFIPDKDGNNVHVEHMAPDKIENCIKRNNINVANAVKLAYNTFGKHYEAIVPVDVKN